MYVKIPPRNFPIISMAAIDQSQLSQKPVNLDPKVLSYEKTTDIDGNSDFFLSLQIYTNVDIANSITDSGFLKPSEIELRISQYDASYYHNKARQTASSRLKNKIRSKKKNLNNPKLKTLPMLAKKELHESRPGENLVITAVVSQFSIDKAHNLYNDAKRVGKISFNHIHGRAKKVRKKQTLTAEKINQNLEFQEGIDNITANNSKVFKKVYNSMIEMNDDPARLFQQGFMKTSFKNQKGGLGNVANKRDDRYQKTIKPIFNDIERSINQISKTQYKFSTKITQKNILKIGTKINISLSNLKTYGSKFNVLMLVKDSAGVIIEVKSYPVLLKTIEDQLIENASEYSIIPARLNTGVSILSIGTKKERDHLDVNLYAKRVNINKPFDMCYYNTLGRIIVPPNKKVKVQDGIAAGNSASPSNFRSSESIFYRTTLNYLQKSFSNAKSAIDKSKYKNEMTPHLTIVVTLSDEQNEFNIDIANISENIAAIRPRKYVFKGNTSATSEMLYLYRSAEKLNKFTQVNDKNRTLRFQDTDVFRTTNYKYVVECIMKNGEKKLASAFFIEKFEERTAAVKIENFQFIGNYDNSPSGEGDFTNISSLADIKKRVEASFTITPVVSEIDKILANMFGGSFELFKDMLKTIRDVSTVSYSIEVNRIDHLTGQSSTIAKLTPNEDNMCTFVDDQAPAYSNITYKLTPRVAPTLDLISFVNDQAELFAKKTIFNSSKYTRAAGKRSRNKRQERIVSTPGNKFAKRNAFLKGLIETEAYSLSQENLDVFFNNSTGDIFYFNMNSPAMFGQIKGINVNNATVELFDRVNNLTDRYNKTATVTEVDRDIKNRSTLLYDVSFSITGNDSYVDFYAFFVKENNKVYLDGIMHSIDAYTTSKKYSYLVKHEGSFGMVEYFIVPFYKDGTMSSPTLVTANRLF